MAIRNHLKKGDLPVAGPRTIYSSALGSALGLISIHGPRGGGIDNLWEYGDEAPVQASRPDLVCKHAFQVSDRQEFFAASALASSGLSGIPTFELSRIEKTLSGESWKPANSST